MKKESLHIIFLIFIGYCCLVLKTLIPSYILLILYFQTIRQNGLMFFVVFICSIFIASVDAKNGLQFLCMAMFISIIGKRFYSNDKCFENYFSIAQLLFVTFFVMLGKPSFNYTWLDILTGHGRLGFTIGDYELNPNILAMLSAIAFLYQINNKKYLLASPHLLIVLLTQSRGALVFIGCTLILTKIRNIKEFSGFVLFITLLFIMAYFSPLWEPLANRFMNDGGSARGDIWIHYIDTIVDNFPFPATREDFFNIFDTYGPLDNLYLMALIRFGIVGLIYCLYLLIQSGFKYLCSTNKFYPAFSISFLAYGIVESGPLHNFMYAIAFSMAYNHGHPWVRREICNVEQN